MRDDSYEQPHNGWKIAFWVCFTILGAGVITAGYFVYSYHGDYTHTKYLLATVQAHNVSTSTQNTPSASFPTEKNQSWRCSSSTDLQLPGSNIDAICTPTNINDSSLTCMGSIDANPETTFTSSGPETSYSTYADLNMNCSLGGGI